MAPGAPEDGRALEELRAALRASEDELARARAQALEGELEGITQSAGELVQSVDQSGGFHYVNQRWRDVLGYSAAEVAQLEARAVVDPEAWPAFERELERLRGAGSLVGLETVLVAKDGRRVRVRGKGFSWRGAQPRTLLSFTDVTASWQAEEARELYAVIFANMQIGLVVCQLGDEGLRLISANPAALRTAPGAEVGRGLREVFPGAGSDELEALVAAVARGGAARSFERVTADRPPRHLSMKAFPLPGRRAGVSFENVTGRKRAQERLRELVDLQEAIFDSASYAIIASDGAGTVRAFNAAAARMLGFGQTEVISKLTCDAFVDRDEVIRRAQVLTSELGRPIAPGFEALCARPRLGLADAQEWTFVRKDGSRFPGHLAMTPLRATAGEVTGFLGIAQDITERRQMDRLKNEFVSTVSHELRTPLTSIRGALGLLEGGVLGPLSTEAAELVGIARANCDRLVRLTNAILDLEKMNEGRLVLERTALDPGELVRTALAGLQGMADDAGVALTAEVLAAPRLSGDRDRLVQVLTNLLGNAIKFSPRGGVVSVRAEEQSGVVRLSVADKGPGIPSHQLHRLFRKFEQLDASDSRSKGGSGLGLAISKAIVEQHRGRIWAESAAGQGATFFVELPLE